MFKMGLLHLPTGEIIVVGSCYSWGYYIRFSAISILLFLPFAKLPELAQTELLLILQLIGWVLPVSMPNMTLQCFSSPCLFYWDLTQTIVPITDLKSLYGIHCMELLDCYYSSLTSEPFCCP